MESFSPLLGRPHPAHTHSPSRALTCSRRDSLPTARFRTRLVHTPKLGFWLRCRIACSKVRSIHAGTIACMPRARLADTFFSSLCAGE